MTDSLQTRFRALDIQLWQTRAFWQPVPFRDPRPAWMSSHPDLAAALLGLTDTEYERLSAGGDTLTQWLSTWLPEASSLATLSALPALQGPALPGWPFGFDRDIPGRKWRQIEAFATCLLPPDGQRLVDWCAGKGHLTRAAALVTGLPAVGLERDPVLCTAGEALARRHGLAVSLTGLDVMTEDVRQHVDAASHCIALHACGDLHLRLMDVAAACSAPALCFSPCCYHKGRPPSGLNPDLSQLSPDADMLRLAVQETVTAKG